MTNAELDALIQSAQDALTQSKLSEGLVAAQTAWAQTPADDRPRRLRVGLTLIQLLYRTGALADMVTLSHEVLPLLRAAGPATQLIDTLRMISLGACETNQFELSLAAAEEALRLSHELRDDARISLSTNALACFFERAGDPWQAERLLLDAVAIARSQSQVHPLFVSLNNLCGVLIGKYFLLRDAPAPEEARETLVRAKGHVEESVALARLDGDPYKQVFSIGNLAEIQVHLGATEQARSLLAEVMQLAHQHGYEAQAWRLACTEGELKLACGHAAQALDQLVAVLEASSKADLPNTRMRLHHAAWRASQALGQDKQALHHLQQYLQLERQRSVRQLRAQSELFVTRMEAEQSRLEAQRQRARARALEDDVRRDQLTGLGNRREVEARWPDLVKAARAQQSALSVAMLDLDQFKQVNDTHGHAVGDQVLVALAALLRAQTRSSDLTARLGGEEFIVVLPETEPQRAHEVCERIRSRVEAFDWASIAAGLKVTISIGLTSTPPYEAETLSLRADAALYRAKADGRNCLVQI